jgi:hypothetical protein
VHHIFGYSNYVRKRFTEKAKQVKGTSEAQVHQIEAKLEITSLDNLYLKTTHKKSRARET